MAQVSRANSHKQSLPPSLGCSRLSVHQIVLLENLEHCEGEFEQAANMYMNRD